MQGPAILDRDGNLVASALVDPVPQISFRDDCVAKPDCFLRLGRF